MPIIGSLLDQDYYIFTMAQVFLHKYSAVISRDAFKCRNNIDLTPYLDEIKEEIRHLCTLRLAKEELDYLSSIPYFRPDFIEFLRLLQLNPDYINVYVKDGELKIDIEGPTASVIWFEVPVLAIVSEVYTRNQKVVKGLGKERLMTKIDYLNRLGLDCDDFRFADFSTRRRFSHRWQDHMIYTFLGRLQRPMLVGTSNLFFAKKYGIKPIGTMAHKYIMAHQRLGGALKDSQKSALQAWADEYRGELGIALSDTVGMDAFLNDFDLYFAKLFDGARHDSGDPFVWCNKLIHHYRSDLKINPITKTAVFSDSLDFKLAVRLFLEFKNLIQTSFGIGGHLSNDMGIKYPNIVIKMVECNGGPVAKISDSKGKGMCEDEEYLASLKKIYRI